MQAVVPSGDRGVTCPSGLLLEADRRVPQYTWLGTQLQEESLCTSTGQKNIFNS